MSLRAQVRGGRLVLDQETDLPEGTVLDLVVDDDGDDLDDAERALLHAALDESLEQMRRGETRDAAAIVDELRARR